MAITEEIAMPVEVLADAALSIIKDAVPDAMIVRKEYPDFQALAANS